MCAEILTALEAAIRAPSPRNTQPWRFELADRCVELFLDESRVLRVADPDGREARISCGAALFNLRMALRSQGSPVRVSLMPERARPTFLARVQVGGSRAATEEELVLAGAVERRRTNRRPFHNEPVPTSVRSALSQAAFCESCRLIAVDRPSQYAAVASLFRHAELMRRQDAAFITELRGWTAEDPDRLDGVAPLTGEPLVLQSEYGWNRSKPSRNYRHAPLLVVLLTAGDSDIDHVRAGLAVQRILLVAASSGVSASFLSAAVELPASRDSLRCLLGSQGYPQVVLQLGHGYPATRTSRRPVADISTGTDSRRGSR